MPQGDPGCVLYHFYDCRDKLLYIGQTLSFSHRMRQHSEKHWWNEVVWIKVDHFDSREELIAAERDLIFYRKPKYNKRVLSPSH